VNESRSPSELAVLKIAADCVGSAIQRDRSTVPVKKPHYKEPENWKNTTEFGGRDRILEATASAANVLLSGTLMALLTALQIIGEVWIPIALWL